MRISFLSSYYLPYTSGAITYSHEVLKYLVQKGHSVSVHTFLYDKKLAKHDTIDGVKVERINYDIRISKGFISLTYPFKIWNHLRNTDVLFLNQPVFEGIFIAPVAKLMGKKIISVFNCQVFLGKGPISRLITFFLNLSVFFQLWLSDKIIVISEDYAKTIQMLNIFHKKLEYILPIIELGKQRSNRISKLRKVKPWICFIGRVSKEKGLQYFVDSYHHLKNKDALLMFAGPFGDEVVGESDYYYQIKGLLKETNADYFFLGKLTDEELATLYHRIDCLVLPSVNRTESFGIVQVEAMLAGTPVVASNMPGVRLPVRLTGFGELAEPGNAVDLAKKIELVLSKSYKGKVQKVREIFDIKKIHQKWDNIIASFNKNS